MKATLDASGAITIEPETPTEAYALGKWSEDYFRPTLPTPACATDIPKTAVLIIDRGWVD